MVSAVVLTKNEEKNIVDCLEGLSFCDEILVIDDNSEDRTIELVKKMKAKVFSRQMNGDFSSQLNFGISKAKKDWVFVLHADERISKKLASEILNFTKYSDQDGAKIERIDYMWGKFLKHGEVGGKRIIRLGKKNKGKWEGKVHEVWNVHGKIGNLKNPFYHFPHPTVKNFLEEINFATSIRAKELYEMGMSLPLHELVTYPLGKFIFNYFFKLGFLDGMPGLLLAIFMSLHSFLVRGKLWQLNQKLKD